VVGLLGALSLVLLEIRYNLRLELGDVRRGVIVEDVQLNVGFPEPVFKRLFGAFGNY